MHDILICILQQRKIQVLEHGLQRGLLVHCDLELAVDVGLDSSACNSPDLSALTLASCMATHKEDSGASPKR